MTGKGQANSKADPSTDQQLNMEQPKNSLLNTEVCSGMQVTLLREYTVSLSSSFVAHQMHVSVPSVSKAESLLCRRGR